MATYGSARTMIQLSKKGIIIAIHTGNSRYPVWTIKDGEIAGFEYRENIEPKEWFELNPPYLFP